MQYDPIKRSLGKIFNRSVVSRKLFFKLLDILLLRAWYIKREIRHFKKHFSAEAVVLDAGAGFGQYSYFMSSLSNSWKVTAVELKPEQVEDCNLFFSRIENPQRTFFEEADLLTYRNPDHFDMILSVDVMEHILEDTQVFENFHCSLKPEGVLIISTPSDKGGSDVQHEQDESFIDEHVRDGYGVDEIRKKLESAGFSDISVGFAYGSPGKISWRLSMKYPIQMVNFSKIFLLILPFYYLITFPISYLLNVRDVHKHHSTGTGLIVKCIK